MRQESQFAIASRLLVLPMHVAEQLADTCLGLWAALHALAVVFHSIRMGCSDHFVHAGKLLNDIRRVDPKGKTPWDVPLRAERSIPAYVETCQMFVALVPRLMNQSKDGFGANASHDLWTFGHVLHPCSLEWLNMFRSQV